MGKTDNNQVTHKKYTYDNTVYPGFYEIGISQGSQGGSPGELKVDATK